MIRSWSYVDGGAASIHIDGRRPDWGAVKVDFSKHPAELLQLLRTGSEIQLRWLSELTRKTKHFLGQLPH